MHKSIRSCSNPWIRHWYNKSTFSVHRYASWPLLLFPLYILFCTGFLLAQAPSCCLVSGELGVQHATYGWSHLCTLLLFEMVPAMKPVILSHLSAFHILCAVSSYPCCIVRICSCFAFCSVKTTVEAHRKVLNVMCWNIYQNISGIWSTIIMGVRSS